MTSADVHYKVFATLEISLREFDRHYIRSWGKCPLQRSVRYKGCPLEISLREFDRHYIRSWGKCPLQGSVRYKGCPL